MPTFPNIERVKGRRVKVVCSGVRTQWDKIGIKASYAVDNPQSAHATFKEKVLDISDGQVTLSGFLGKSNNVSNLPQIGQIISDLSFTIAENEMIPPLMKAALTAGIWRVINTDYESSKDSAKWNLTIEPGFVDGGEDALDDPYAPDETP